MDTRKPLERSVDSLQRIYSFILALSIGQAITIVVLDAATRQFKPLSYQRIFGDEGINFALNILPIALAYFATIIPFHQGMNRHLDSHYLENRDIIPKGGLLLDFIFFMAEGGLFFAIASSIRQADQAYFFFALLMVVDIIWALVACIVHRTDDNRPLKKWPGINFVTLFVGSIILGLSIVGDSWKAWLLFMLALGRTVCDYRSSWDFYFPFESASEKQSVVTE